MYFSSKFFAPGRAFTVLLISSILLFSTLQILSAKGNEEVARAFRALIEQEGFVSKSKATDAQKEQILKFYESRNFKPIWVRDKGPKGKAKALAGELKTSIVHGLSPEFYNFSEIAPLMRSKKPEQLARLEMLLTGALVEFGGDLMNGRIGPDLPGSFNAIEPQNLNAAAYIREAEESGNLRNFMGGLLRSDKRYVRLITKLVEFLRVKKSGIWPEISAEGGEINKGQSDPRMKKIRVLLSLYGDLSPKQMNDDLTHDDDTFEAVRKFQGHLGLDVSGNIDKVTLAEMAVPLETRIYQIKLNLERRRWQVSTVEDDHLYINLIDGSLRLVKDGKVIHRGKLQNSPELHEVPTFLGMITELKVESEQSVRPTIEIHSRNSYGFDPSKVIQALEIDQAVKLASGISGEAKPATGDNIVLKKPFPIFVTYTTAWANRDGKINFRRDNLKRDAFLRKHLFHSSAD